VLGREASRPRSRDRLLLNTVTVVKARVEELKGVVLWEVGDLYCFLSCILLLLLLIEVLEI